MGLARTLGTAWDEIVQRHLELIGAAVVAHGGTVIRTEGDARLRRVPGGHRRRRGGRRDPASPRGRDLAGRGHGPRPGRSAHGRGPSLGRRLRRLRRQPRGPGGGGRARRPGRPVRDDGSSRRRRAARRDDPARPRPPRPQGRAAGRAPEPARHRGPAVRLPAAQDRRRAHRQPARSPDVVHRSRRGARRARDPRAGRAAGDAHRSGRHRQDEPGDRDGPGARSGVPGRRLVREPRRRRRPGAGPRGDRARDRTVRRPRAAGGDRRCCRSWRTSRWSSSSTTWSTCWRPRTRSPRWFTRRRPVASW